MPPKPLMDLSQLDPETTVFDREAIRQRIPQRDHMEMLDRIILLDVENGLMAGVKEVRDDEFWVSGHFPDRPVLPGVLMVETAGQLASFWFRECGTSDKVLAFAAADKVRFRGVVIPGDALVMVAKLHRMSTRSARVECQAFVRQNMVFEGTITGMVI